ncbi:MAG TPA: efflux RND transporter permease subunit [Myxococcota bacterium]|nr:efflux RND transporter permease subunit [Myxococcota bacterium]HNZ04085.1 efflux RND transporter permease subunit [Myxococcota bacterium]HPB50239.1 efflux RND transporter permease subunit [Myxococcota bacterium]HQP95161.1 efflux RND transporter permease subunit [Myxococcota bacterium]
MKISDVAINRPVLTGMVALALLVLGGLAFFRLPLSLFPEVSFPIVAVVVPYPGASPEEVETQVTRPIEDILSGVNDVDNVRSFSRDSVSQVVVTFKMTASPQQASNDVRDRLAMIRGELPPDIMDPIISRFDPASSPILAYAVSGTGTSAETRRIVADIVSPAIQRVDGVGSVTIQGGDEREIRVEVDRAKLDAAGIGLTQLAQLVGAEGIDVPGGRVTTGDTETGVKAVGRYQSVSDIGDVVLMGLPNGAQLHVRDVAEVVDGVKEARTLTRVDGQPGVSFVVQKQASANTVDVVGKVEKTIADLGPQLPQGMVIKNVLDNSTFIENTYFELRQALILGAVFAVLVIFLFMLDWRSTVISAIALPISVIATFFVIWQLGFSLNLVSMISMSLAIGLLIDDSVVVRENIFRHMERGEDAFTAARRGTHEIAAAVIATTLTIVAVFAPIAFTAGLVGKFLKEFGITVSAAVLVSLVVSLTVDPMLSARLVQNIPPDYHERRRRHPVLGILVRGYDALDEVYRKALVWALAHKKTVVFGALAVFLASLALTQVMGFQFIPRGDQSSFSINLQLPAGTALQETDRVTRQVEEMVRAEPEVLTISTTVGPGEEVHKATINVVTTPAEDRDRAVSDIMESLRPKLSAIPGVTASLADAGPLGQSDSLMEAPFTIRIHGAQYDELARVSGEVFDVVRGTAGIRDAAISFKPGMKENRLVVDRTRSGDLGVTFAQAAMTLRLALTGAPVAKFSDGTHDIDVRVVLRSEDRAGLASALALKVPTNRGAMAAAMGSPMAPPAPPPMVAMGDIVRIEESEMPSTIERSNRERYVTITANLAGRSLGEVMKDLQPKLDGIEIKDGYRMEFAGDAELMKDTYTNMALAMIIGVLFIYFVLASQFESLVHPLTIMLSLPLALIGAVVFLFIFGIRLDVIALIGVILLMGLVTKNSILLVDYTNQLRERGMGIVEAVLEAGPTRLRPILMTSAAMVLGMLPTAMATGAGHEFRVPMSISVIGGVISSTFLTLVVVPVVYIWLDRFTIKGRRERAVAAAAAYRREVPTGDIQE